MNLSRSKGMPSRGDGVTPDEVLERVFGTSLDLSEPRPGNGRPGEGHHLLAVLVAAVEADHDVEALLEAELETQRDDLVADDVVIDLRDRTVAPTRRPRQRPDEALALVLNRVRYKALGVDGVSRVGVHDHPLTELAALGARTTPPDAIDLVRQATAHRSNQN
jgi:hypothetical protein